MGIAFSHIFDYNANYSNVISRFFYEAIGLSHWNTEVFMIKLIEVVTTMSTMRDFFRERKARIFLILYLIYTQW